MLVADDQPFEGGLVSRSLVTHSSWRGVSGKLWEVIFSKVTLEFTLSAALCPAGGASDLVRCLQKAHPRRI